MFDKFILRPGRAAQLALLLILISARRVLAADQPATTARERYDDAQTAGAPHGAVYSLIDRLAARGVLTKQDTNELLLVAEADEADMRAQAAETQAARAEAAAARARLRAVMAQLANGRNPGAAAAASVPQQALPAPSAAEEPAPETPPVRQKREVARAAPAAEPTDTPPAETMADNAASEPAAQPRQQTRRQVDSVVEDTARAPRRNSRRQAEVAADEVAPAAPAPARRSVTDDVPAPAPEPDMAATEPTPPAPARAAEEEPAPRQAPQVAASRTAPAAQPANEDDLPAVNAAPPPDNTPGRVRVAYVPEVVKEEIKEEVKQEILSDAAKEGWATPGAVPDWVGKFRLSADLRLRYEMFSFPAGNLPADTNNVGSSYWNFNAINTGAPYDLNPETNISNPPFANVDQERNRLRIRARIGASVDFAEGCSAGMRLATGESSSPVSENQTLGSGGGNFSKYAVWVDRVFLRYERGGLPNQDLTVTAGRFDNPFFATSMLWADDLAFDGLAIQGKFPLGDNVTPFFNLGGFPVYNTDLNFATNHPAKYKSYDKYLAGGQLGIQLDLGKDFALRLASAYYLFHNIEGKVSSQYVPVVATDAGDTDASRPSFAQSGNTYIALRDIAQTKDANGKLLPQFQYFGLATPFHELTFTAQLDYNRFEPFQISLIGEFARNLAFDQAAILKNGPPQLRGPVNNNSNEAFGGGNNGWITSLRVGRAMVKNRWDWNASIGYRKVESDAVVDGFCDSDFGGGGTNWKGYTLAAKVALLTDVWFGVRYMSATSIAGPALKNDIFQFDINSRF